MTQNIDSSTIYDLMIESGNTKPLSEIVTSRRAFFATVSAMAVGASVYEYGKLKKDWDGIETKNGLFIPLYENHLNRITSQQLPKDLDIFFKETGALETIKNAETDAFQDDPKKKGDALSIPPDVIVALAKNGTEIMFGDAKIPSLEAWASITTAPAEILAGGTLGACLLITSKNEQRTTRRKLLRAGLGLGALWGLSNVALLGAGVFSNGSESSRRVAARISHMSEQFHPEDLTEFIRSLLWSAKMLNRARDFKEENGRKARIAFNVGIDHGNVENFLHAGQDFCHKLLLSYPAPLLESIVDANGGIEAFAGYTLIKLPGDLDPNSTDYDQKIQASNKQYLQDYSLAKKLKTRLRFVV